MIDELQRMKRLQKDGVPIKNKDINVRALIIYKSS